MNNALTRIVHNDRHGTLTDSVQPRAKYVVRFDGADRVEDVPRSECRMETKAETREYYVRLSRQMDGTAYRG